MGVRACMVVRAKSLLIAACIHPFCQSLRHRIRLTLPLFSTGRVSPGKHPAQAFAAAHHSARILKQMQPAFHQASFSSGTTCSKNAYRSAVVQKPNNRFDLKKAPSIVQLRSKKKKHHVACRAHCVDIALKYHCPPSFSVSSAGPHIGTARFGQLVTNRAMVPPLPAVSRPSNIMRMPRASVGGPMLANFDRSI